MAVLHELDTIPAMAEGRRLAALYFGEQRYGVHPHAFG